ncbi:ABC transporter substrate-binding protein [Mesorhizobium sp. 1M-11]|uniref:heme/hemin ABC transporter substrate-binding protein n=1 Tax=Mesorhizobium sp. 1M-11 TaxID=1529006 RepID=UPI0009E8DBCE|nr:ABC transporter substrate-binding protein [Mesorhizobium sp. 1M-11]
MATGQNRTRNSLAESLVGRLIRRCVTVALFLSAAAIFVCSSAAAVEILDARGRLVETGSAKRIVALGSDITEIVFGLGAGERIVAVDRGSKYPHDAANKPNVGYRRKLSVEGLAALDPDLIIAAEDIGPAEAIDVLSSLKTPIVYVPEDNSRDGIRRKIDLVAAALDLKQAGTDLSRQVTEAFDTAAKLTADIPTDRRKKVVFFHGLVRLTAAGSGTAADAIIRYAGGINPMAEVVGYKAASEEKLIQLAPDVVLMMSDGKGGPTASEVFSIPALAATPAAKDKTLVVLDGAYMIGFGPRTADAIRDLAKALYPDVASRN